MRKRVNIKALMDKNQIEGNESRSRSSSHLSVSSSTLDETSYQEPPQTPNHHREEHQPSYMPGMSEKKKKNKFLSLFSRKKSFKPNTDVSFTSTTDGGPPQRSHTFTAASNSREVNHYSSTPQLNQPQQLSVHSSSSSTIQRSTSQNNNISKAVAPAKPPRKKRPAPPPPAAAAAAAKTVDTVPELSVDIAASAPNLSQAHSRTSSHSSGFESASSPLESPSSSDRNAKKPGEVTAESAQKLQAAAPTATGARPKSKKRAAPRPPGEAKPRPEAAASPTLSSSSRSDICEFQPAIHEGATSTPIRGEDSAADRDSGAATDTPPKSDIAAFVEQMTELTEKADDTELLESPRSTTSSIRDTVRSPTSSEASNSGFDIADNGNVTVLSKVTEELALPDSDEPLLLARKSVLDEQFLSESHDSGIGTETRQSDIDTGNTYCMHIDIDEANVVVDEITSPIDTTTEFKSFVSDEPDVTVPESGEITFDHDDVEYVKPEHPGTRLISDNLYATTMDVDNTYATSVKVQEEHKNEKMKLSVDTDQVSDRKQECILPTITPPVAFKDNMPDFVVPEMPLPKKKQSEDIHEKKQESDNESLPDVDKIILTEENISSESEDEGQVNPMYKVPAYTQVKKNPEPEPSFRVNSLRDMYKKQSPPSTVRSPPSLTILTDKPHETKPSVDDKEPVTSLRAARIVQDINKDREYNPYGMVIPGTKKVYAAKPRSQPWPVHKPEQKKIEVDHTTVTLQTEKNIVRDEEIEIEKPKEEIKKDVETLPKGDTKEEHHDVIVINKEKPLPVYIQKERKVTQKSLPVEDMLPRIEPQITVPPESKFESRTHFDSRDKYTVEQKVNSVSQFEGSTFSYDRSKHQLVEHLAPVSAFETHSVLNSEIKEPVKESRPPHPKYEVTKADFSRTSSQPAAVDHSHSFTSSKTHVENNPARTDVSLFAPRGWGARQSSEPSVRDVRKALAVQGNTMTPIKDPDPSLNDSIEHAREETSKINFSPSNENEQESFMEDKSISQIALPAQRKSILKNSGNTQYGSDYSISSEKGDGKKALAKTSSIDSITTPYIPKTNVSEQEKRKKSLQDQYVELQSQFSKWQQQLLENQELLAKKNIVLGNTDISSQPQISPPVTTIDRASSMIVSSKPVVEVDRTHSFDSSYKRSDGKKDNISNKSASNVDVYSQKQSMLSEMLSKTTRVEPHETDSVEDINNHIVTVAPKKGYVSRRERSFSSENKEGSGDKTIKSSTGDNVNGGESYLARYGPVNSEAYKRLQSDGYEPREGSPTSASPPRRSYNTVSYSLDTETKVISNGGPPVSPPPPLPTSPPPPPPVQQSIQSTYGAKVTSKRPTSRFEPKLDPREELMIAIRNASGRNVLRKVTTHETHWT